MAHPETITPAAAQEEDALMLADVQAGLASLEAGRSIPYEQIRRWLLSWGAEKELPPPKCP